MRREVFGERAVRGKEGQVQGVRGDHAGAGRAAASDGFVANAGFAADRAAGGIGDAEAEASRPVGESFGDAADGGTAADAARVGAGGADDFVFQRGGICAGR